MTEGDFLYENPRIKRVRKVARVSTIKKKTIYKKKKKSNKVIFFSPYQSQLIFMTMRMKMKRKIPQVQ